MKKFMFTAIAMIAIVGSSMANTIEVDEQFESKSFDTGGPARENALDIYVICFTASNAIREKAQELAIQDEELIDDMAEAAFNACVAAGKKK